MQRTPVLVLTDGRAVDIIKAVMDNVSGSVPRPGLSRESCLMLVKHTVEQQQQRYNEKT